MSDVEVYQGDIIDAETGEMFSNGQASGEGWFQDESGLPIFVAHSSETIDQELLDARSVEGGLRLGRAAVLTEASEKRFYGEGSLERTCKDNKIDYSTGQSMVHGYKRLRRLEILDRSRIVSAILSGELYWSKAEIAAGVKDDTDYAELMNEAADGSLSNADMRKRVKELRAADEVPELPAGVYRVLYADPPWQYADSKGDSARWGAATSAYPTMSTEEICNLKDGEGREVTDLSGDDSVLFLWATSPMLPDALQVMEAWGFTYKSSLVWDKVVPFYGHYSHVRHELLLVGTKGRALPDSDDLPPSVIVEKKERRHSRKPEVFRELVDNLYTSGTRVELFARGGLPGNWAAWGSEVEAANA